MHDTLVIEGLYIIMWPTHWLSPKPVQTSGFMSIGATVIELHEFNDKKKKNMDKMGLTYNFD